MPDIHDTEQNAGDRAAASDETQASQTSRPDKRPAAFGMEWLAQLHPRSWVPVWSDPQLAADAEAVVRLYAAEDAPAHILALARDIAEAEIDQRRVGEVRFELEKNLSGRNMLGEPPSFIELVVAAKRQRRKPAAQVILAIDRYEQRTFSRWRKARKAFDTAVGRDGARHRRAFAAALRRLKSAQRGAGNKRQAGKRAA